MEEHSDLSVHWARDRRQTLRRVLVKADGQVIRSKLRSTIKGGEGWEGAGETACVYVSVCVWRGGGYDYKPIKRSSQGW